MSQMDSEIGAAKRVIGSVLWSDFIVGGMPTIRPHLPGSTVSGA